jgi:hypothetical protein
VLIGVVTRRGRTVRIVQLWILCMTPFLLLLPELQIERASTRKPTPDEVLDRAREITFQQNPPPIPLDLGVRNRDG